MRHVTRVPTSNSETAYRELMLADDDDRIEGRNELDAMLASRERAEEAIGPVTDLSEFSDSAQALHTGNDRRYGPQACVFTRDSAKAMRAWERRNRKRP